MGFCGVRGGGFPYLDELAAAGLRVLHGQGDLHAVVGPELGEQARHVGMISGIAFGALLLASAPAIVLYFVLPITWGPLGSIPALEGAARWLDGGRFLAP